jgi:hypothetical protein
MTVVVGTNTTLPTRLIDGEQQPMVARNKKRRCDFKTTSALKMRMHGIHSMLTRFTCRRRLVEIIPNRKQHSSQKKMPRSKKQSSAGKRKHETTAQTTSTKKRGKATTKTEKATIGDNATAANKQLVVGKANRAEENDEFLYPEATKSTDGDDDSSSARKESDNGDDESYAAVSKERTTCLKRAILFNPDDGTISSAPEDDGSHQEVGVVVPYDEKARTSFHAVRTANKSSEAVIPHGELPGYIVVPSNSAGSVVSASMTSPSLEMQEVVTREEDVQTLRLALKMYCKRMFRMYKGLYGSNETFGGQFMKDFLSQFPYLLKHVNLNDSGIQKRLMTQANRFFYNKRSNIVDGLKKLALGE